MLTVIFHDHVAGHSSDFGSYCPRTAKRIAAKAIGVRSLRGLLSIGTRFYAPGASDTTGCSVDVRA